MRAENEARYRDIRAKITLEQDPHKVVEMVNEIGRLLKGDVAPRKPSAADYLAVLKRPRERGSAAS